MSERWVPKRGDSVYTCSEGFLSRDPEVHREFVLAWEPGNRFELGESMRESSTTFCGPLERHDEPWFFRTPREAVDAFIESRTEQNLAAVEEKRREIERLLLRNEELRLVDRDAVEVRSYPEDWEPCEY